jgi:hypothetical protein
MEMVNIDDLRNAARRRLPKIFFDYIDGGGDNRSDRTFGGRVGVMQRAELAEDNRGKPRASNA